ncbi:MAG TPA: arsenite methyltransferase [Clostridiales bacterium]|nr:arsenite methyltransferase [Clostridiales bacterium]
MSKEIKRNFIRKQYSKVAKKEKIACCSGCCCGGNDDVNNISFQLGYTEEDLKSVRPQLNMGLGCGNPIAIANLKEGEIVLDLGSGGGFDCFLARRKVGEKGYVIGIDMTSEMITLARKNNEKMGYKNVEFRLGEIERLSVADGIIDVIISNCVINLALNKQKVFKEAYRVLKKGGRLSIADVLVTAKLPEDILNDLEMLAACISGAEHIDKIKSMLEEIGFTDINMTPKENSREIISAWVPGRNIEDYVTSYIIEAIK